MPTVGATSLSTFAQEDVTVDATAGGVRLTIATFMATPPAKAATLTVETAQIRWTKSSTSNLTASTRGHLANVGTTIFLDSPADIWNFRAIRTGTTSGNLRVEYHR